MSSKTIFGRIILGFEKGLTSFTHWITNILKWSLNHKRITLAIVLVLFVSSLYMLAGGFIGGEFFSKSDRGEFLVQMELPKDASIEQTNQITQKAEAYLRKKLEVIDLVTMVGQTSEGMAGSQSTAYKSEIRVKLIRWQTSYR